MRAKMTRARTLALAPAHDACFRGAGQKPDERSVARPENAWYASCVRRARTLGVWRSLVAHTLGVRVVAGSNPATPTAESSGRDAIRGVRCSDRL